VWPKMKTKTEARLRKAQRTKKKSKRKSPKTSVVQKSGGKEKTERDTNPGKLQKTKEGKGVSEKRMSPRVATDREGKRMTSTANRKWPWGNRSKIRAEMG